MDKTALTNLFTSYCHAGDKAGSDAKKISKQQIEVWLKKAKIIDKNFTEKDVQTIFGDMKGTVNFDEFMTYIDKVGKQKSVDPNEIKKQLLAAGLPDCCELDKK